jgi:hypothetical protein
MKLKWTSKFPAEDALANMREHIDRYADHHHSEQLLQLRAGETVT